MNDRVRMGEETFRAVDHTYPIVAAQLAKAVYTYASLPPHIITCNNPQTNLELPLYHLSLMNIITITITITIAISHSLTHQQSTID
jgi:hypothetical protein